MESEQSEIVRESQSLQSSGSLRHLGTLSNFQDARSQLQQHTCPVPGPRAQAKTAKLDCSLCSPKLHEARFPVFDEETEDG